MGAAKGNIDEVFGNYRSTSSLSLSGTEHGTTEEPDCYSAELAPKGTVPGVPNSEQHPQGSFDDFFTSSDTTPESEAPRNQSGTDVKEALTLKEAVEFYKISEKTIRLHITQGKIPARKEQGQKGLEWRIYPSGIPQEVVETSDVTEIEIEENQPGTDVEPEWNQPGSTNHPDWNHAGTDQSKTSSELERLLDVIQKQSEKLEAANYRIGFLEAQTSNYEQQVKLLTDSRHKRGHWSRFWSWFTGSP